MINILCHDAFRNAVELSNEHYDKTLKDCFFRMVWYSCLPDISEVRISEDYDKHSFFFRVIRNDGSNSFCGGIIFHDFPESGYKENGSVMLKPRYGWSIHT